MKKIQITSEGGIFLTHTVYRNFFIIPNTDCCYQLYFAPYRRLNRSTFFSL